MEEARLQQWLDLVINVDGLSIDFCPKSFTERSKLNRHVKAMHTLNPDSYECSVCHKKLQEKQSTPC